MKRLWALHYLLVATSKSLLIVDLSGPSVNPSQQRVSTDGSAPSRLPRSDSADPPRLPGAALAFERGTECDDRSVVAGGPDELGADG